VTVEHRATTRLATLPRSGESAVSFKSSVLLVSLVVVAGVSAAAAERQWQIGVWVDVITTRQLQDFGPGGTSFNPPPSHSMRAMADVRVYVIETDAFRFELKEIVRMGHGSIEPVTGQRVTFAVEKNSVYVRDADGKEHKLQLAKKTPRPPAR
jgi:hypothetical protein